MKQRTCAPAIMAALVLVLYIPVQAGKHVEVGPKLGVTLVTMAGDQASDLPLTQGSDPDFLPRVHLEAFVSVELKDYLAIQTEIAFVERGADWEKSMLCEVREAHFILDLLTFLEYYNCRRCKGHHGFMHRS